MIKNTVSGFRRSLKLRSGDWQAVVLCIFAAASIWVLNSLNESYNARISYPIVIDFDHSEYINVKKLPRKIDLNVSGNGWNILRKTFWFDIEPVSIFLSDPLQSRAIATTALLPSFESEFPDNVVNINYFILDTLYLDFQPLIDVRMPVVLDTPANLVAQGYVLVGPVTIKPDTIALTGAASYIDSIGPVYPLTIAQRNLQASYDERVPLDSHVKTYVSTAMKEVNISFGVEKLQNITREIPVQMVNFPEDSSLTLQPAKIQLSFVLREGLANTLADSMFRVEANFSMMEWLDSTLLLKVSRKPAFLDSVLMVPERVKVQKRPIQARPRK